MRDASTCYSKLAIQKWTLGIMIKYPGTWDKLLSERVRVFGLYRIELGFKFFESLGDVQGYQVRSQGRVHESERHSSKFGVPQGPDSGDLIWTDGCERTDVLQLGLSSI